MLQSGEYMGNATVEEINGESVTAANTKTNEAVAIATKEIQFSGNNIKLQLSRTFIYTDADPRQIGQPAATKANLHQLEKGNIMSNIDSENRNKIKPPPGAAAFRCSRLGSRAAGTARASDSTKTAARQESGELLNAAFGSREHDNMARCAAMSRMASSRSKAFRMVRTREARTGGFRPNRPRHGTANCPR